MVNMDIRVQVFGEICFIFRKFLSYFNVKIKIRKQMIFSRNLTSARETIFF